MRIIVIVILLFSVHALPAQSFNEEKTAAVNFIKRVYQSAPFEGAKSLEGDQGNYFVVAVSTANLAEKSNVPEEKKALELAQKSAEEGFAEPCVRFEMIGKVSSQQKEAYLFLCETLSEFVWQNMKKKPFDGARIVATPNQKYLISVLTLDATKYPVKSNMDKVASMKSKQMANVLLNGSTISSEQIISTDENNPPQITESIREQAMGFVQGLELLTTKELKINFYTYIFYAKI
jgi:hypothetical protein